MSFWDATTALADILREAEPVQRFAGTWRGEPQVPGSELPQRLGELLAGFNMLRWQPFLLSLRIGQVQQGEALAGDPASNQFRTDSIAITGAMIALVEWLRSRLPRYPVRFRLPYTDPLSSRVAEDGFPDQYWPWSLAARRMRLQARPTVAPVLVKTLRVDESSTRRALDELVRSLHTSGAWQRYAAASEALTEAEEETLTQILHRFRVDVGLDAIRAIDLDRPVRRMFHRHAVLRRAEAEAAAHGGAVGEYYTAFRRLDRALSGFVAVLGQQLIFGPLDRFEVRRVSWRRGNDDAFEVAVATSDVLRNLNVLAIQVESELAALSGPAMVEGVDLAFKRRGEVFEEDVHLTGVLLPN